MNISLTKRDLASYLSILLVTSIFWAQPFSGGPRIPVVLLVILGTLFLFKRQISFSDIRLKRFCLVLSMFFVPAVLSMINSIDIKNSLKFISLLPLFIPFAAALLYLMDSKSNSKLLETVIILTCCFWVLDGFIQFSFGKDMFGIMPWAEGDRINGPFAHHLRLSLFLSITLPLVLFRLKENGWLWQLLYLSSSVFIIILSGVRTDLLTALLAILLYVVVNKKAKLFLTFIPLLLAVGLFASHNSKISEQKLDSFTSELNNYQDWNKLSSYRLDIWLTAKNMLVANPMLGVGVRGFSEAYHDYTNETNFFAHEPVSHAHHPMISILAETGVIGFGGLIVVLVLLYRWGRQTLKQSLFANPWFQILILMFFPIQSMPLLFSLWWFPFVAMVILLYLNDINRQQALNLN